MSNQNPTRTLERQPVRMHARVALFKEIISAVSRVPIFSQIADKSA